MSLSSSTLASIQKAGAAVFAADEKVKTAVKEYAQRVNAAIANNPYNLGNDSLFENWKVLARLSQTIAGMEDELKKVYRVATELTADDQPSVREIPALAAPARTVERSVARQNDLAPSDVVAKRKKKAAKSKKAANKTVAAKTVVTKASPAKPAVTSAVKPVIAGNSAKLLPYLERVLNSNEFTVLSQTAAGHETGIPIGSMTAATKKLIESGRVIAGPAGTYKLA